MCSRLDRSELLSANSIHDKTIRWTQGKKAPNRLGVSRLREDSTKQTFIQLHLSVISATALDTVQLSSQEPEENSTVFRDAVYSSAMSTLRPISRKHEDCFDENDKDIQGLLEERSRLHKAHRRDTSSIAKKAVNNRGKLTDMQDSWLSRKADESSFFANGRSTGGLEVCSNLPFSPNYFSFIQNVKKSWVN